MTANSTCTDARNSTDATTWMSRNTDVVLSQAGRCDAVVARPVFSLTVRPTSAVYTARADRSLAASIALAGLSIVAPVLYPDQVGPCDGRGHFNRRAGRGPSRAQSRPTGIADRHALGDPSMDVSVKPGRVL